MRSCFRFICILLYFAISLVSLFLALFFLLVFSESLQDMLVLIVILTLVSAIIHWCFLYFIVSMHFVIVNIYSCYRQYILLSRIKNFSSASMQVLPSHIHDNMHYSPMNIYGELTK